MLSSGVEPGVFSYLGFLGNVWGDLGVWDWDGCLVLELLANLQWKWMSVPISIPWTASFPDKIIFTYFLLFLLKLSSCQTGNSWGPKVEGGEKPRGSASLTAKLQHTRSGVASGCCWWGVLSSLRNLVLPSPQWGRHHSFFRLHNGRVKVWLLTASCQ